MAKKQPKPQAHFILQGKGGVGKSVTARLLAEYFVDRKLPPVCFDADGNNRTFAAVSAFNAKPLDLEDPETPDEISTRAFDEMIDDIAAHKGPSIIDVGAGTYRPLVGYVDTNGLFETLADGFGVDLYIHTIVTGGESRDDTVANFTDLASRFSETANIVVWLNNYWGKVAEDGMPPFEEWKAVQPHRNTVAGLVVYPPMKKDTFLVDFREMMKQNTTFADIIGDGLKGKYGIAPTSRMKKLRKQFWEQLDLIFVADVAEKEAPA